MWSDENEFRKAVAGMPIDDAARRTHQEELKRRVLRTFDEAAAGEPLSEETGRHSWPGRRIMRHRIVQIGVALAAACLVVAFVWPFGPGAGVAFARVQELNTVTASPKEPQRSCSWSRARCAANGAA